MAYSDAQKEATARYNKKAYDRINLIVRKGKRKRTFSYQNFFFLHTHRLSTTTATLTRMIAG